MLQHLLEMQAMMCSTCDLVTDHRGRACLCISCVMCRHIDVRVPNEGNAEPTLPQCTEVYGMCVPEGISIAAEEALQQGGDSQPQESPSSSPQAHGGDPPTGSGMGWKGQQGVIGDLVHLWVAWSPQPCQAILGLLQGALAQVPSQPLTGKKAQEPVGPYPGNFPLSADNRLAPYLYCLLPAAKNLLWLSWSPSSDAEVMPAASQQGATNSV